MLEYMNFLELNNLFWINKHQIKYIQNFGLIIIIIFLSSTILKI